MWLRNDLDELSDTAHRLALVYGEALVTVWHDGTGPRATIERPTVMTVQRNPVTREVDWVLKRVRTRTTTEVWLHGREEIRHYRANSPGATTAVLDEFGEPVIETVSPIGESDRIVTLESENAKVGQLDAARLDGFTAGIKVIMSEIQMVTGLPAHYVGVLQDSVTSADALRAAEAALVSRAEAKAKVLGREAEEEEEDGRVDTCPLAKWACGSDGLESRRASPETLLLSNLPVSCPPRSSPSSSDSASSVP